MSEKIGTSKKIPKVIHYCWFGGNPIPESVKMCISSWKKYCPDYKIIQWSEKNYDTNNVYAKEALEHKKWAFYSDYARLDIIYQYGGIYLDTDVELLKNLDELLDNECFLGVETTGFVATGLGFGAVKNDKNIKLMIDEYKEIHFARKDGTFDVLPCPMRNTHPFVKYGFSETSSKIQHINGATVYPPEYFCPLDYITGKLQITNKTISIHHYNSSWLSSEELQLHKIEQSLFKKFGMRSGKVLYKIISLPYRIQLKLKQKGIYGTIRFILEKMKKV